MAANFEQWFNDKYGKNQSYGRGVALEAWNAALKDNNVVAKTAHNTGSPKLPSSTEVWKMVVDLCADKKLFCEVEAARAISEAVYKFIYRQLRASA